MLAVGRSVGQPVSRVNTDHMMVFVAIKDIFKKNPKNISEKNSVGQPVESKHWPYDGFHDEDEHEVVKM